MFSCTASVPPSLLAPLFTMGALVGPVAPLTTMRPSELLARAGERAATFEAMAAAGAGAGMVAVQVSQAGGKWT